MKSTFLIFISTLILFSSKAQIANASASHLERLTKRKLIVVTKDYSSDIDYLTKKIEKTNSEKRKQKFENQLERIDSFISHFNKNLKKAMEDGWELNENFEFMTNSEALKVVKGYKSQYSILKFDWYQQRYSETDPYTHNKTSKLANAIPTFFYYGADGRAMKHETYQFYIPTIDNLWNDFTYEELLISIKLMQLNIKESIDNNSKRTSFGKFTKKKHKNNCPSLSKYTLYIDNSLVADREDYSAIKQQYNHKLIFRDTEQLNELISMKKEDNALLLLVPYIGGQNFAFRDPLSTEQDPDHTYYILLIDMTTYEPLAKNYYKHTTLLFKTMDGPRIYPKSFKRLNACKY